jgi:hypothetical protein
METGKAIYSILTDADLTGGATVHPEVAPENAAFPFVVYSIQNIAPSNQKQTTSTLDESTLEVYVMSNNYGQCMDVAAECRAELDRNAGSFNGVEVQSIQFDTAEISYSEPQECYYVEQIYTVRVLRTGQAPASTLLPLNAASITIQEVDSSPQFGCSVLKFPNGTLTIDQSGGAGSGVANYTPVWEVASFRPDTTHMQGGASQIDFSSQSAQALPFDFDLDSSGSGISHNAGGRILVTVDGWYRFTCSVIFDSDTQHHSPRMHYTIEGQQTLGSAGGSIIAQHQVNNQPINLSRMLYVTAGQRVSVVAYDESDKTQAMYVSEAVLDVERMA